MAICTASMACRSATQVGAAGSGKTTCIPSIGAKKATNTLLQNIRRVRSYSLWGKKSFEPHDIVDTICAESPIQTGKGRFPKSPSRRAPVYVQTLCW